ncbi:MAG: GNAT family N-acetyltransferase [Kiritimatiellia bacterium]
MLIQGERVGLAALEPSAAASLHAWMHEPELRRLAFMEFNFPQPLEAAAAWIRDMNQDQRSRLLAVHRLEDQALIGLMTVRKISWISQSARFGIMLWPPDQQGKGLGTEARRIFLDHVFRQLGFRRIYGDFASTNTASRKSHEKLGAVVSATARESTHMDGGYLSLCHYTYQRERFLNQPEPAPRAETAATGRILTQDLERAWMDFCLLPDLTEGPARREEWIGRLPRCGGGDEVVVLQSDWPRRNATLLSFRREGDTWRAAPVASELLADAVRMAFDELNAHRVQAFLPSTARSQCEQLADLGFQHEGALDSLHYSAGRFVDLVVLGRVRDP